MPQYRKRLRLADFDYGQAGTYFITVCVKDRKCILGTIPPNVGADVHISPQVELSHYGKVVEKYIQQIYGLDKYVIMPNHIHLIVRIDENLLRWELARYYEESLDRPLPS